MRYSSAQLGKIVAACAALLAATAGEAAANCQQDLSRSMALIDQYRALARSQITCNSQGAIAEARKIVNVLEQIVAAVRRTEANCSLTRSPLAEHQQNLSRYRSFMTKCTAEIEDSKKTLREVDAIIRRQQQEVDESNRAADAAAARRGAQQKKEHASKLERVNSVSKAVYSSTGSSIFNCNHKPLWNAAAWDAECRKTSSSGSSRTVVRVESHRAVHRWGTAACRRVPDVYQRVLCGQAVRVEIMLYQVPEARAHCGHLRSHDYSSCVDSYFTASLKNVTNESASPQRATGEREHCDSQPPQGAMQRYFPDPDREQWSQRAKARCPVPQNQAYDAANFRSCVDRAKVEILIDDDRIVSHECRGVPNQDRCVDDALEKGIEVGVRMCGGRPCPPASLRSCSAEKTVETPQQAQSLLDTIRGLVGGFSRVPPDDEPAGTASDAPGGTPNAGGEAGAPSPAEPTATEKDEIYCSWVADRLRNRDPNFSRAEQIQPECLQMSLIRELLAAQSAGAPDLGDGNPDLSGFSSERRTREVINRLVEEFIQLR